MISKIFCLMNHLGQGELLKDKDGVGVGTEIKDAADFRDISGEERK